MPRPIRERKPMTGYIGAYQYEVRSIDLIRPIFKKALEQRMWVFDPSTKRWLTPEEFMAMYERYENIDRKWIDALEIRDPAEGLDAADQQIQSITLRRTEFAKRIIDYFKKK